MISFIISKILYHICYKIFTSTKEMYFTIIAICVELIML